MNLSTAIKSLLSLVRPLSKAVAIAASTIESAIRAAWGVIVAAFPILVQHQGLILSIVTLLI